MSKRLIFFLVVLSVIMTIVPVTGAGINTVDAGSCGEHLTWMLDDSGTLTIMGHGIMDDFMPKKAPWYIYNDDILQVVITQGVKNVGNCAFYNCYNVHSVVISDSVTEIGNEAFWYCKALSKVKIPETVTVIGSHNFISPSPLTIYGASGSEAHRYSEFNKIAFLTDDSGNEVCYIKQGFENGNGTEKRPFGSLVEAIDYLNGRDGTLIIVGSYDLTAVHEDPWYGTITLTAYDDASQLTIPASAGIHFYGKTVISDIPISTGANAHINSEGNDFVFDPGENVEFNSMLHMSTYGNTVVENSNFVFNSGNIAAGFAAGAYCSSYNYGVSNDINVEINGGYIKRLSLGADYYGNLKSGISIGNNLNVIINGGEIYQINCPAVTPPVVHGAVNIVFNNGTPLPTHFGYPEGEKGEYVIMSGVGGKIAPTETAGVFSVTADNGKIALINGSKVSDGNVTFPQGKTTVEWVSGKQNSSTQEAVPDIYSGRCGDSLSWTLEDGTLSITGNGDMYDYSIETLPWYSLISDINNVVIGEGVTSIGNHAFRHCFNINNIEIPDSVTKIGDNAFDFCYALKNVLISEKVTSIGSEAFSDCLSLDTVILPYSLEHLGYRAFFDNKNLVSAWINSSDVSVDNEAFDGCDKLIIFGKEDSTAQVYASENYIPFYSKGVHILEENKNVIANGITSTPANGMIHTKDGKMLPLTTVANIFGAVIASSDSSGAVLVFGNNDITLSVGDKTVFMDNGIRTLDIAPIAANGTIYVSLNSLRALFNISVIEPSDTTAILVGEDVLSVPDTDSYYVKLGAYGNGTEISPFGHIEDAISNLSTRGGNIYIYDEYNISEIDTSISWNKMITIASADTSALLTTNEYSATFFNGPVTISNINCEPAINSHFNTNGYKFVFDAGENAVFDSFMHFGANIDNTVEDSYAVIKSGKISDIYAAGSYVTDSAKVIGDATVEIDGGYVERMVLSADYYLDSMTGIEIGGNLNIVVNSGTLERTLYYEKTMPKISGALNIVLNNDTNISVLSLPDCSEKGTYIIRAAKGGMIYPTDVPGQFKVSANEGKIAVINGVNTLNGIVTLSPGETKVTWTDGDQPAEVKIQGDADNNGRLDMADVELIRQYLIGDFDIIIDLEAADCNSDGVVNTKDITLVLQRLA